jgi:hypothetical protein
MSHDVESCMQFADVLLPGDDPFPSASASGMAEILVARLRNAAGRDLVEKLSAAIAATGGPLAPLALPERAAVVARLEKSEPKLFDEIRKIIYVTYYEQAAVIAAIQALGTPYNVAPLPDGYPAEAFPSGRDAPKHRRGHWLATERVTRIDLSSLGHLEAGE